MHVVCPALRTYAILFDALNERIPWSYWVHIWYWKTRMAGLQSSEGRTMIDSVAWVQCINLTDTQLHSHVAMAIAALTHCALQQPS